MIVRGVSSRGNAGGACPRPRARLALVVCTSGYLFLVVAFWAVLRLAGDRCWIGTLLLISPRWPVGLPLLALWPWAVATRKRIPLLLLLVSTAVLLVPVLGVRASLTPAMGRRHGLRIVTCNVHRRHVDAPALNAFLARIDADVVSLQGWASADRDGLLDGGALRGWHVCREGEFLLASRFPLGTLEPIDLSCVEPGAFARPPSSSLQGAAIACEVFTSRGTIRVISVHLASPHSALLEAVHGSTAGLTANLERRSAELQAVIDAAETAPGVALIVGDFNTTDDSPFFRAAWRDYCDAFNTKGSGLGWTYVTRSTQLRIDHVLAGPGLEVCGCSVGPDVGSPHRPLVADVDYR